MFLKTLSNHQNGSKKNSQRPLGVPKNTIFNPNSFRTKSLVNANFVHLFFLLLVNIVENTTRRKDYLRKKDQRNVPNFDSTH